jgi:hypothetical protein
MLSTSVLTEAATWDEVMSAISDKRRALSEELAGVEQQIKTAEEQAKIQDEHVESLKARLATLKGADGSVPQMPMKPEAETANPVTAAPAETTTDYLLKEKELIELSTSKMLVVKGKEGDPTGGFPALQDGKVRIFVSAQWLDLNPSPTVSKIDRSSLPIREELACPAGVDLVCLLPEVSDLPHFELAVTSERPMVGARVVVIFLDPNSMQAKGIGGSIRGIGPDTLELDAELTATMTGAPVLSLDSGKVIGIVAPQIAGVKDEWAIGTRHQGSRNFATRIDRIREWKTSDFGRFANEAAYVKGINQRTRIAWLAHMLLAERVSAFEDAQAYQAKMDSQTSMRQRSYNETDAQSQERRKREMEENYKKVEEERRERMERAKFVGKVRDEARKSAGNPHIVRATNWTSESIGSLGVAEWRARLSNVYRGILADLSKQEPDLSEHMTPYHLQQYRIAKASRAEGIRIISLNAKSVGQ